MGSSAGSESVPTTQRYVTVMASGVHEPREAVRARPTWAVPLIVGAETFSTNPPRTASAVHEAPGQRATDLALDRVGLSSQNSWMPVAGS